MMKESLALLCVALLGSASLSALGGETEAESSGALVDVRQDFGGSLSAGTVRISPVATDAHQSAVLRADGQIVSSWTVSSPLLDVAGLGAGWHELTLQEVGQTATARLAVVDPSVVEVHGGTLTGDETWAGNRVHVIKHLVRVPVGTTLTLAQGAVVKFCTATELAVEGTLKAHGAVFTTVQDDTVGGDTDMTPMPEVLPAGDYNLTGEGRFELTDCAIRYRNKEVSVYTLNLVRGWNLVSLPARVDTLEQSFPLHVFVVENGCYVRASLPQPGGKVLWVYSKTGASVRLESHEEMVNPSPDVTTSGRSFVGVAGISPVKVARGTVQVVWQWKDGRYQLKTPDPEGGFTLEPCIGYLVF